MTNRYTDSQVSEALAALSANEGNVKATARQLGIPRTTLIDWRDKTAAMSHIIPTQTRDAWAARYAQAEALALARLEDLVPDSYDLRAVVAAVHEAREGRFDSTDGRRGASVSVSGDKVIVIAPQLQRPDDVRTAEDRDDFPI